MKEYTIDQSQAGKRLDKWLLRELPLLPMGLAQKYIRTKEVKVNGRGAQRDTRLNEGDVVRLYIPDEFFEKPHPVDTLLSNFRVRLSVVYEDENLLLIDKQPGMMVHPDDSEKLNTLVTHVRAYLYQKGEYDSKAEGSFSPVPCNRIDRFTGGIVIFAKNAEAMREMNRKIRDREIEKDYLCIVHGHVNPPQGLLEGYIIKPENRRKVLVLRRPTPGAQYAATRYQTLQEKDGLSLIECELLTGRTHQIRAQFADAGHPLLGDYQYGDARTNRGFDREFQALYAYKLVFSFKTDAGVLNGLKGRSFEVRDVPFVQEYFAE